MNANDAKVYELIWKRTIASQMTDATGETVTVRLGATAAGRDAEFSTSGTIIAHQGFRLAYVADRDEGDDADEQERQLPALAEGDALDAHALEANGHDTQPPARFTEASLVKRLEELGIGRPSTYASTIKTIQDREYVWKKGTALVPSFKAFAVVNLLEQNFPEMVDYTFTARMEDDLDQIAGGDEELVPWLAEFYFGPADDHGQRAGGLKEKVSARLDEIDAAAVNAIPIGLDPDGVLIVAKPGRDNSPYLVRGDDTASIPTSLAPDELTVDKALELLAAPKGGRELGVDPATGLPVYAKTGRFGPYVQLGDYDDESDAKPKMASLFKTMTVERVTLDDALELLGAPPHRGGRSGRRRRDHRSERQVRALPPEGGGRRQEGQPQPHQRRAAVHGDPRRGRGHVRPAQAASGAGGQAPAAGAGGGPGERQADDHQGRSLRALRDGRRDQRLAAQVRRRGHHHRRAGRGAAGRSA